MNTRRWITALGVAVLVVLGVVVALDQLWLKNLPPPVRSSGTAQVGGPFTLTDQAGNRVSASDFRGKYMLVVFGYTHCPDICPGELQVISTALDTLGDKAKQVQPLFITIDPERDTQAILADYISNFHESFLALRGSEQETAETARAYRVYYKKAADQDTGKVPAENYLMDHSTIIYLMDRDGKFIAHFSFGAKPDAIAEEISDIIG